MLSLRGVRAGYGDADVLRGIDLDVLPGETVALVGANGAGKSTLLKTISGLVRASAGDVRFGDALLTRLSAPARVRRGIAHVPEGRDVFAGLTVRENLLLGAYARPRAGRLDDVLAHFPALRARLDAPAAELSGGQQQMLAIGRGLMAAPALLLLDEPSLGLSPLLVTEIFDVIRGLRGGGTGILIAEQNARMTLAVADRAYVLENGRIVLHGTGAELLTSPEVVERYLGVGSAAELRTDAQAVALAERLSAIFATSLG